MANELYINEVRADLSDDNPIAINYQVNDLANLSDRQSTFSNTIKLPLTANNATILGQAQSDAFTQSEPYELLPCKLIQNGIEIIVNGVLSLLRVTDNYECQITYGLRGLQDALKKYSYDFFGKLLSIEDAKLVDLDWSDIPDFNYDLATVAASQTVTGGTGVLWPVIDYGDTLTTASEVQIKFLRPGIYFNQIFDHIAKFTGYSFSGGLGFNDGLKDFIPFSDNVLFDYQGTNWDDTHIALSVAKNLPDFTVKNVLKDFMQRYFLTPVVDNFKKTVVFNSFDELYLNKGTARDWTNKFSNESRSDEFEFGNYAQANNLKWNPDAYMLSVVDGIFFVNNENLDSSVDLVTSIFAASNTKANVAGGKNVAQIKKVELPGNPFFHVETEVRVVRIANTTGALGFVDGTGAIIYANAKIGQFEPITWDEQLSKYGTGLMRLLKKARVVTRTANLSELDVQNFDFFTPVYDAREGQYYYINKISNFIPGKKTKLSMIRM